MTQSHANIHHCHQSYIQHHQQCHVSIQSIHRITNKKTHETITGHPSIHGYIGCLVLHTIAGIIPAISIVSHATALVSI